jgi:hypothetical protein
VTERRRRLRELREAVYAGPLPILQENAQRFEDCMGVLTLNAAEFDRTLKAFGDPSRAVKMWAMDPDGQRPGLRLGLLNVSRVMINYVASAAAAVAHTRPAVTECRRHDATAFPEFETRYRAVEADPGFGLVAFLRNRGLHVRTHANPATLSFGKDAIETSRVFLDRTDLMASARAAGVRDGKAKLALEFLAALPTEIEVSEVRSIFDKAAESFLLWCGDELWDVARRCCDNDPRCVEMRQLAASINPWPARDGIG